MVANMVLVTNTIAMTHRLKSNIEFSYCWFLLAFGLQATRFRCLRGWNGIKTGKLTLDRSFRGFRGPTTTPLLTRGLNLTLIGLCCEIVCVANAGRLKAGRLILAAMI